MPKEVIFTQSTPFMPVVVWDRGKDMRLGLIVSDSTMVETLYGAEAKAGFIGAAFREIVANETAPDDERLGAAIIEAIAQVSPFESIWADLTRGECNDLVRVLRRARNAAFGQDE